MVTHSSFVFEAIADPTRRAIVDLLATREWAAGELAERFPVSRPAISRHVRILRRAGLVRERKEARHRFYSLDRSPLTQVDQWLAPHRVQWAVRLHDLRRVVEDAADPTPQADGG